MKPMKDTYRLQWKTPAGDVRTSAVAYSGAAAKTARKHLLERGVVDREEDVEIVEETFVR